MVRYITQKEATELEIALLTEYKYSEEQLLEMAGQSVAVAVDKCFNLHPRRNVLICCGQGNNEGIALVCARYLSMFQYDPIVFYPKRSERSIHRNLVYQCLSLEVEFISKMPSENHINADIDIVIDALFGFSFSLPVPPEYTPILHTLKQIARECLCSIDVPSGWDVEKGPPSDQCLEPTLLVSLTAPKLCSKYFLGEHHFLGGRYVPKRLAKKYNLQLPAYPGSECCFELKN